jgi:uncharacterized iron-regulated membrane protein
MSFWQSWLRQPQGVWLRKALFQVHLWTGIGVAIYVVVVCVSGSLLVFRPEIATAFMRGPVIVKPVGTPMTDEQLTEVAQRAYPGYQVVNIFRSAKPPNAAAEVWMENGDRKKGEIFDPFTGADLGPSVPLGSRAVSWMLDLHDNLLTGENGRTVNGVGGMLLTLLSLSGVIIWWPGIKNWRRSLGVHFKANWKRITWDLHSAIGFWTAVVVFMFAFTGFYLVFQLWFSPIVDKLEARNGTILNPSNIENVLVWLPRLHFGRFRQVRKSLTLTLKIVWVILGLAPAILSVTGVLMWWNRVVRKVIGQSAQELQVVRSASLETVSK